MTTHIHNAYTSTDNTKIVWIKREVFYPGRCACHLHACPSNMLLSQPQYSNFQKMLQTALPALDFYGNFSRQMDGEIIIKRISRAPIYRTRWEHRALYNNTDHTHTQSHTHSLTHTQSYTHTHTHTVCPYSCISKLLQSLEQRHWKDGR